jgi:hypothetical protein
MQHFLSKSHWDSPPASQRGKKVTLNPPVFQGDISNFFHFEEKHLEKFMSSIYFNIIFGILQVFIPNFRDSTVACCQVGGGPRPPPPPPAGNSWGAQKWKGGADPTPNFESGGQCDILNYRLFCLTVFPNLLPHDSHEIVHIETWSVITRNVSLLGIDQVSKPSRELCPFLLVLYPYIMPFIMLHESRQRRKFDTWSYDNVKMCTQFSCLRKKHHE